MDEKHLTLVIVAGMVSIVAIFGLAFATQNNIAGSAYKYVEGPQTMQLPIPEEITRSKSINANRCDADGICEAEVIQAEDIEIYDGLDVHGITQLNQINGQGMDFFECGNQICEGSEIVYCDNDCSYNIDNPITMYDFVYDESYPSSITFKVRNHGEELTTENLTFAFVGNGRSCNYNGFGYLHAGHRITPSTIPPSNTLEEFTEVTITGLGHSGPLLASSRHCDMAFRIGMFSRGQYCGEEEYLAIANTVLKCA